MQQNITSLTFVHSQFFCRVWCRCCKFVQMISCCLKMVAQSMFKLVDSNSQHLEIPLMFLISWHGVSRKAFILRCIACHHCINCNFHQKQTKNTAKMYFLCCRVCLIFIKSRESNFAYLAEFAYFINENVDAFSFRTTTKKPF